MEVSPRYNKCKKARHNGIYCMLFAFSGICFDCIWKGTQEMVTVGASKRRKLEARSTSQERLGYAAVTNGLQNLSGLNSRGSFFIHRKSAWDNRASLLIGDSGIEADGVSPISNIAGCQTKESSGCLELAINYSSHLSLLIPLCPQPRAGQEMQIYRCPGQTLERKLLFSISPS